MGKRGWDLESSKGKSLHWLAVGLAVGRRTRARAMARGESW